MAILHHFQDITKGIAYMTALDLEQSFNWIITVKVIAHACYVIHP